MNLTKKIVLPIIIVTLAFLAVNPIAKGGTTPATSQLLGLGMLSIVKLHTNATGISACTVNISTVTGAIVPVTGTLYGKIRVILNATWTQSNSTYGLSLASFALVITQKNMVVSNSTNINQNQAPTNIIQSVNLFPDLPVILILSFAPVCVSASSIARLYYTDGLFGFTFNLP